MVCGLWSPVVNVCVGSERHEEEAPAGQHHQAAGVLRLLQDLLEMLVADLDTGPSTGSSHLRDEHQHELPLRYPHPVRFPVLQLQPQVEVELEGSGEGTVRGARQGRHSINSFNQVSPSSPSSLLSPDRLSVSPDRHINSVYCCKTCLVRPPVSPALSK